MSVCRTHVDHIQKKMSGGCLPKPDHVKKEDDNQPPADGVKEENDNQD